MNKARLLKMADFVETIPRNEFNMSLYGAYCGPVGCALGHAAVARLFPGLKPIKEWHWMPVYRGKCGMNAAVALFGLTYNAAVCLFIIHHDNRIPKQVAHNIRKFVKDAESRQ
jgi:hypothetical protein